MWREVKTFCASNIHITTLHACNMTFFWTVSVSLEREKKYEQLLPFYYLCVCKSDSFIRFHFYNFCSLNAQTQKWKEWRKKARIAFYGPFSYTSLGIFKRIQHFFSLSYSDIILNKLEFKCNQWMHCINEWNFYWNRKSINEISDKPVSDWFYYKYECFISKKTCKMLCWTIAKSHVRMF